MRGNIAARKPYTPMSVCSERNSGRRDPATSCAHSSDWWRCKIIHQGVRLDVDGEKSDPVLVAQRGKIAIEDF